MIPKFAETVCIRCGKLRIFSRKWEDKTDGRGPLITHMESVCPDSDCQKIVDEKFAEIKERRDLSDARRKSVVHGRKAKLTS